MFDNLKAKLRGLVDKNSDKIADGVDKGGEFIDSKTDRKHTDKIEPGKTKVTDALDGLDGEKDDFPDRDETATRANAPAPPATVADTDGPLPDSPPRAATPPPA